MANDWLGEYFPEEDAAVLALTYPGSKQKLRSTISDRQANMHAAAVKPLFDMELWGAPRKKTIRGVELDFYAVGSFARAMGRSVPTIRAWERFGRIPPAPFILPGRPGPRGDAGKRRYYTAEAITTAMEVFHARGLLYAVRIDWAEPDAAGVLQALAEGWAKEKNRIVTQIKNTDN